MSEKVWLVQRDSAVIDVAILPEAGADNHIRYYDKQQQIEDVMS